MCQNGTMQWKHNGNDVTNNTHYIINATSGTLTIPAVRSSDNGTYTCNSSNVSLTVKSKIFESLWYDLCKVNYFSQTSLIIIASISCILFFIVPNITITGHNNSVKVGGSVSINCTTVPPIPNSEIKWQLSSYNSDSNELIINPVMLSHNNKTFTCVVSSDLLNMNLRKDITITVLGQ